MLALVSAATYALLMIAFTGGMLRALLCRLAYDLPPATGAAVDLPSVTVVVPARDEARTIQACLASLVAQDYPKHRLRILLVDDHSSDETRLLAAELAAAHSELRVIQAPELASGWTGKSHACHVGAAQATGDWICFVDADTRAEPCLLRTTITHAQDVQADLLSISPFQELGTFGERLVLPAIFLAIAATMDFRRVNDPSSKAAVANGQFMLFRRAAYDHLGGHGAVKAVVHEDLAFAAAIKGAGMRLRWVFGDRLMTTRMYTGLGEIFRGFSKNMFEIMSLRSAGHAALEAGYHLLLALLGPVLLVGTWLAWDQDPWHPTAFAVTACAAVNFFSIALGAVRELRVPWGYALAFPLGFAFHAALILSSLRQRQRGQRSWKGRTYGEAGDGRHQCDNAVPPAHTT